MKARAKLETLAIDRPEWKPEAVTLDLEFKPPGRCDDDGCVASFKAYRDGIAEALGVDDRIFKLGKVSIVRPGSKPGWVKATLTLLARQ